MIPRLLPLLPLLLLFVIGASAPAPTAGPGAFQIVQAGEHTFKLDTVTGRCWRFRPTPWIFSAADTNKPAVLAWIWDETLTISPVEEMHINATNKPAIAPRKE